MNIAILSGRVGKTPEVKSVGENKVSSFPVATSENYKDNNGEWKESTEWHRVEVWRDLSWLGKGDAVVVQGSIKTDTIEKDNGDKVYFTKIRAVKVERIVKVGEKAQTPVKESSGHVADANDDLPY